MSHNRLYKPDFLIETPHLQGYGISACAIDFFSITKELQAYDRSLDLGWIPEMQRNAIIKYIPEYNDWIILKVIQNEDGSYRVPDQRDVLEIKMGDMQNNKEMSYDNMIKNRQKQKESEERRFEDMRQEMAKDLATYMTLSGESEAVAPVSMFNPKKGKKKDK